MDTRGELEKIKRRLELTERDQEAVLTDLLVDFLEQAMAKCNREEGQETPVLLSIVRDAVCAAYRRRGDEGSASASVGGQSTSYEDITDKMHRDLIRANQRLVRL